MGSSVFSYQRTDSIDMGCLADPSDDVSHHRPLAIYVLDTFSGVGLYVSLLFIRLIFLQDLRYTLPVALRPRLSAFTSVAWDHNSPPHRTRIATGSIDGTVIVWTAAPMPTNQTEIDETGHEGPVESGWSNQDGTT